MQQIHVDFNFAGSNIAINMSSSLLLQLRVLNCKSNGNKNPLLFLPYKNLWSWFKLLYLFFKKEFKILSCTTEYTYGIISFTRRVCSYDLFAKLNILHDWLFARIIPPKEDSDSDIAITPSSVSEFTVLIFSYYMRINALTWVFPTKFCNNLLKLKSLYNPWG